MPLVFSMDGSDDVLDFASVNLTRNGSVPLQLQGRRLSGGDEGATPRTSFSWSAERNTVTLRVQGGSACEREMPYDRLGLGLALALTLTLTLTLALTLTRSTPSALIARCALASTSHLLAIWACSDRDCPSLHCTPPLPPPLTAQPAQPGVCPHPPAVSTLTSHPESNPDPNPNPNPEQGGCFPLLQAALAERGEMRPGGVSCLFNPEVWLGLGLGFGFWLGLGLA